MVSRLGVKTPAKVPKRAADGPVPLFFFSIADVSTAINDWDIEWMDY